MLAYRNWYQPALAALVLGYTFSHLATPVRAIVIDDFSVGPITVTGPSIQAQTGLDPAHVLGGSRSMDVGRFGSGSVLAIDPTSGFNFSSTGWGYFTLKYDLTAGGAGTDLTAGGHDRIRLRFGEVQTPYTLFGLYLTLPPNSSSNGISLPIQSFWDDLILEVPYSAFPASPTMAQNLSLDVGRNPAGASFVIESITTAGTPIPGDYNRDGTVDSDDLAVWRRYAGMSTRNGSKWAIASADGNADGRVDAADFIVWQKYVSVSTSGSGASTSAPEPSAVFPVSITIIAGLLKQRRFSRHRG
jgi:hypothetical protein